MIYNLCLYDTAIIAVNPNDFEFLVNKVKQANAEVYLELNLSKTKVMSTGKAKF